MSMSKFRSSFAKVGKIPEPQFEMVDLNERVSACKIFMENICRNNKIAITLDLCEESPEVNIDTTLFEQVMLNIIKNSAESIGNNGNITIKTSVSPVMLEITDNGKGISKEVEPSLFTPFFSTKPNGQGIGLIFIRDVLLKHNCSFTLKTYGDKKTRFSIRFKE